MTQPNLNVPPNLPAASRLLQRMDLRTMTQSLVTLAEDNMAFFSSQGPGETARRLTGVFAGIREQALGLEPTLGRLLSVAHLFDLDTETPANGYRSLVHTARCCLAHLLHKSRYVASNRRSIFFRTSHNLAELEAYLAAVTQLRALAYYAQRLLTTNQPGRLFFEGDERVIADFLREYVTLHKGCFYGRCLGFQVSPPPPACPPGPMAKAHGGPNQAQSNMRAQSLGCVRLFCDPMGCSPPGFSVRGISPGKNTRVGCYSLLQGTFQTQGSNPRRLH